MTTQTCEPDRIKAKGSEELVELVPDLQAEEMDERLRRACFGHGADTFSLCRNTVRAVCRRTKYSAPRVKDA